MTRGSQKRSGTEASSSAEPGLRNLFLGSVTLGPPLGDIYGDTEATLRDGPKGLLRPGGVGPSGTSRAMASTSSAVRSIAAPRFSSRWARLDVPGIGSMKGERRNSQANDYCWHALRTAPPTSRCQTLTLPRHLEELPDPEVRLTLSPPATWVGPLWAEVPPSTWGHPSASHGTPSRGPVAAPLTVATGSAAARACRRGSPGPWHRFAPPLAASGRRATCRSTAAQPPPWPRVMAPSQRCQGSLTPFPPANTCSWRHTIGVSSKGHEARR